MSEAVAAAATAAATPAAPPPGGESVSAMTHGLDAILGDLSAETAEAADSAETNTGEGDGGENSAEPAEVKDTAKEPSAPDDEIFSEEALDTREGVIKAKIRVQELRKLQHQKYLELKGYERHVRGKAEKLKTKVESFKRDKATFDWERNTMRSNLQGMYSGNKELMVASLGQLTGKDGIAAVEEFISVLTHGQRPKLEPHLQQMLDEQRRQIEELRNGFANERTQAQVQQLEGQIEHKRQAIAHTVLNSTTTPHLTRIFKDDQARLTSFIEDAIVKTNGTVPIQTLLGDMEKELQSHFGAAPPQGASGGTAPKQPHTAQSSPGRSVGPSVAAAATQRAPSEEESLRALANDHEFLAQYGL
jgi:hypothetical protein